MIRSFAKTAEANDLIDARRRASSPSDRLRKL